MKTIFKLALSLVMALPLIGSAMAQDINYDDPRWAKYGATTEEREKNVKNYSFFLDAAKMNSFVDAERRLQELVVACPSASETLYHYGTIIYQDFMNSAEDNETKFKHLDNVIKMYNLRIENFGNVDRKGKKNRDVLIAKLINELVQYSFVWDNKESLIVNEMEKAVKLCGANIDSSLPLIYFKSITDRYLLDKASAELVLAEYDKMVDAVSKCNDEANKAEFLKTLDNLLFHTSAASCENLEHLFKAKYEKDPNNVALIANIIGHMTKNECESSFKTMLTEKYYKLKPSADAAYALANSFVAQNELTKAITYFNEAVTRETDRATRSVYESKLAATYLMTSDARKAANLAQRAIASDPRNGLAHFFLGQSYCMLVPSMKCDDAFQKKAVYWLIVDLLSKAKSMIPAESAQQSTIAKTISTCQAHYPTAEDIFFKEIKEGETFDVNCDIIKGKTVVKKGK